MVVSWEKDLPGMHQKRFSLSAFVTSGSDHALSLPTRQDRTEYIVCSPIRFLMAV